MEARARVVGFVGLGVMGGPMAGHLLRNGHKLVVWNRTPEKAQSLVDQGAELAHTLSELAGSCDLICICVTASEDVHHVLDGILPYVQAGTIIVDHSTIAPSAAYVAAQRCTEVDCTFLDAPITGGSMGAQAGTLTIFVGGDHMAYEEAKPILESYAKRIERVGESGMGQTMKLANQIAVGGALLGLCESLAFAREAGLDVAQAHDMIGGGAGGSWAFANYGPKLLKGDWSPGFSIDNQSKDFRYCLDAAVNLGLDLSMTEVALRLLSEMQAEGRGSDTTAALFEHYRRKPA